MITIGVYLYIHSHDETTHILFKMSWLQENICLHCLVDQYYHSVITIIREPSVQSHAKTSDPISVMSYLREEKNNFKPKM